MLNLHNLLHMNATEIIPKKFEEIYGEEKYFNFYTCLNELRNNFKELKHTIAHENLDDSRAIIHQMISSSSIIFNDDLNSIIKNIQLNVKSNNWGYNTLFLTEKLGMLLNTLYQGLGNENPDLNIIIYGRNKLSKNLTQLLRNIWPNTSINDLSLQKSEIEMYLICNPVDLFFVFDQDFFDEAISTEMHRRIPGTSICMINEQDLLEDNSTDFIGELEYIKLNRPSYFNSMSSTLSF